MVEIIIDITIMMVMIIITATNITIIIMTTPKEIVVLVALRIVGAAIKIKVEKVVAADLVKQQ